MTTKPKTISCPHMNQIRDVKPVSQGCADCLAAGDSWVHLRMCLSCGYVGCCNDSKNKHAAQHFQRTNHPIMRSIEPGERWRWCFIDEQFVKSGS